MKRWLFRIIAAASLVSCLASLGLWARSIGHFELCQWRYARWLQPDEVDCWQVGFAWYSNTLRLEVIRSPIVPSYFQSAPAAAKDIFRMSYPPGLQWDFVGDGVTGAMNGYGAGFAAAHYPYGTIGIAGDRWVLAVRPWLPTLLFAVLPAIWLYGYRKAARSSPIWQFGLRELFVVTTAVAVLLFGFVWLMN